MILAWLCITGVFDGVVSCLGFDAGVVILVADSDFS